MRVPKLAKNGFYSSLGTWGLFWTCCMSMSSLKLSALLGFKNGIKTIFEARALRIGFW
jgi:hypothetical protein